jgi:hypothetical protein
MVGVLLAKKAACQLIALLDFVYFEQVLYYAIQTLLETLQQLLFRQAVTNNVSKERGRPAATCKVAIGVPTFCPHAQSFLSK